MLGRTTFEKHLREAENRAISAPIPYLELFSSVDRPPERMPLSETPAARGPPSGATS